MVYCNGCGDKDCEFRSLFDAKCSRFKPKTNADRIRTMTDEELATWLAHLTDCVWCPCHDPHDQCDTVDGSCKKQWLNWLKEEARTND